MTDSSKFPKITPKNHKDKQTQENYEEDFNQYQPKSPPKLLQLGKIQNRSITSVSTYNVRTSPKFIHKNPKNSPTYPKSSRTFNNHSIETNISYILYDLSQGYKINTQFESIDNKNKTNEDLEKQLKGMRDMLIQLNNLVTNKLNKYQLVHFEPKGMAITHQPQKQSQILASQIENNKRIIEALEKQIKEIKDKDKELQEKDYLIQLQETTNNILKSIKEKRKQRVQQGVAVQKRDNKLKQMKQAAMEDQFKMVKVIKHNILYYFKKLHENRSVLEELDKNYKELMEKDEKITEKYNKLVKIAEQKNMIVKANKAYLENKKINDELLAKLQQAKKKVEVYRKSNQIEADKIEKEIDKIKKEIALLENKTDEAQIRSKELTQKTDDVIEKNSIGKKLINSISYKFAQSLLRGNSIQNGNDETVQGFSDLKPDNRQKKKALSKPKLKIKRDKSPLELSIQTTARYHSQEAEEVQKKQQKVNDKNMETINLDSNKSKQFRIKPNIHIKKKADAEAKSFSTHISPIIASPQHATTAEVNQLIYKPTRFQKILSLRKNKDP